VRAPHERYGPTTMVRPFASPSPALQANTWYGHLDLPSVTSTPQSNGGVIASHSMLTAARAASSGVAALTEHSWPRIETLYVGMGTGFPPNRSFGRMVGAV